MKRPLQHHLRSTTLWRTVIHSAVVLMLLAMLLPLPGYAATPESDQTENPDTSTVPPPASKGGNEPSKGGVLETIGDRTKSLVRGLGGLIGGVTGYFAADALANAEGRRLNLSKQEVERRKRGYRIAFALMGIGGGSALAGSLYEKLSEEGRKAREKALIDAAKQGTVQRYREPTDATITGTVTPGKRYTDIGSNRLCVDTEDRLADTARGEETFAKVCEVSPGDWKPVTV